MFSPPVQIPNPDVKSCVVKRMRVLCNDNRILEKIVIESQSGKYYEVGRYIRDTIFGHVNHALLLQRSHGDILVRSDPIEHLAMKVYMRSRLREMQGRTQENPFKEMSTMQFISQSGSHSNVIRHIECCADNDNVYSLMEFCDGGELYDLIESQSPNALPEGVARYYFRQILHGTKYLHSLALCHRDMSLENVLITKQGVCKIIDMGMCLRLAVNSNGEPMLMPFQGVCGKKNYIAPEVIEGMNPYNPLLSDVWALGVMLFILVTGVPPVDAATHMDPRYRMICRGNLSTMLQQWDIQLSSILVDLLSKLLKPIPIDRLTINQIMQHPWMQLDDVLPPPNDENDSMSP